MRRTRANRSDVEAFLAEITGDRRRLRCRSMRTLVTLRVDSGIATSHPRLSVQPQRTLTPAGHRLQRRPRRDRRPQRRRSAATSGPSCSPTCRPCSVPAPISRSGRVRRPRFGSVRAPVHPSHGRAAADDRRREGTCACRRSRADGGVRSRRRARTTSTSPSPKFASAGGGDDLRADLPPRERVPPGGGVPHRRDVRRRARPARSVSSRTSSEDRRGVDSHVT